jgi:hypothetical protein
MSQDLQTMLTFFDDIGMKYEEDANASGGPIDGIYINHGTLRFNRHARNIEANLLHEAGHVAIIPAQFRDQAEGDLEGISEIARKYLDDNPNGAGIHEDPVIRMLIQVGEAEAIAWTYAVVVHLNLDLRQCFEIGFPTIDDKDGSTVSLRFKMGDHYGIHGLKHAGMTDLPQAKTDFSYPKMHRWMQI